MPQIPRIHLTSGVQKLAGRTSSWIGMTNDECNMAQIQVDEIADNPEGGSCFIEKLRQVDVTRSASPPSTS